MRRRLEREKTNFAAQIMGYQFKLAHGMQGGEELVFTSSNAYVFELDQPFAIGAAYKAEAVTVTGAIEALNESVSVLVIVSTFSSLRTSMWICLNQSY